MDNAGDVVIENLNEGTDAVYRQSIYNYRRTWNTLVLQGSADLRATATATVEHALWQQRSNLLNGEGGADAMYGGPATTPTSSTISATR